MFTKMTCSKGKVGAGVANMGTISRKVIVGVQRLFEFGWWREFHVSLTGSTWRFNHTLGLLPTVL